MSRRGALGVGGALVAGAAAAVAALRSLGGAGPRPAVTPGTAREVESFGPGERRGEWWVPPAAGRLPTVVLAHGGYWRPGYDRSLEDAVAADLSGRGYLCWVLDYASSASPWPATLTDVAAGYDALTTGRHGSRVDAARIAVVGHSAGGHLALWLASRHRLPAGAPGADPRGPRPALAVAQAPVASFGPAAAAGLGGGAVPALLGGTPAQVPDRYRQADPVALLPTGVRTVLVHGTDDDIVPLSQSEAYVGAAVAAGDPSSLVRVPGGHFAHLDPASAACAALRTALASV